MEPVNQGSRPRSRVTVATMATRIAGRTAMRLNRLTMRKCRPEPAVPARRSRIRRFVCQVTMPDEEEHQRGIDAEDPQDDVVGRQDGRQAREDQEGGQRRGKGRQHGHRAEPARTALSRLGDSRAMGLMIPLVQWLSPAMRPPGWRGGTLRLVVMHHHNTVVKLLQRRRVVSEGGRAVRGPRSVDWIDMGRRVGSTARFTHAEPGTLHGPEQGSGRGCRGASNRLSGRTGSPGDRGPAPSCAGCCGSRPGVRRRGSGCRGSPPAPPRSAGPRSPAGRDDRGPAAAGCP